MSYLNPLRLHFAGQFQASISTVNNDPVHYDNRRFEPQYQDRQTQTALNGWFNPRGDANWRLLGCKVTGAWMGPATPVPQRDPVWTYLVGDSDVSGRFEPAPFTDIWSRTQSPSAGDADAGACYQSVLTDLEWGDIGSSPFLTQLYESADAGLLSIKFNVDSFNLSFRSPDFMKGRITGTIGPAGVQEPRQLVLGRHFLTTTKPTNGFFAPAGGVNMCVARVDRVLRKIYLDLGNALPIGATGAPVDLGPVTLACIVPTSTGSRAVRIDALPASTYTDPGWYPATAGVVELPASRTLTDAELGM